MLPGPDLGQAAWRRRRVDQRSHSIIGVTHTTATHRAIDLIADLLIAPVQPWDALICTSASVLKSVETLLDEQSAYLADRTGANRFGRPMLPVIPLGVDTDTLCAAPRYREEWRTRLGISSNDVAVLYFGRLSHHGKAHPSPMFAAVQQAVEQIGPGAPRVHIVLGGWFASDSQKQTFETEAARLAPDVTLHHVDGRTPEARAGLWGAADIFTLLSDNIQETFGLAPVEAMAAGIPVIVSDWNGFRDTVRDGVDGFRIPTVFPSPGLGRDLAAAHEDGSETYDAYMGSTAQFCAVDVPRAAEAFVRLIGDPALRAGMGAAGRRSAMEKFSWSVVIDQYEALWAELASIRTRSDERAPLRSGSPANPRRMDPTTLFASYPTGRLKPEDVLEAGQCPSEATGEQLLARGALALRPRFLSDAAEIDLVLTRLSDGPQTAGDLASLAPAPRRQLLFRTLLWLLKHDAIRLRQGSQGRVT